MKRLRRTGWVLVLAAVAFALGCADTKIDDRGWDGEAEEVAADLQVIANNLNYPRAVRIVDNDDPLGTGSGSVLGRGQILVACAGQTGNFADSITVVDAMTGTRSVFSDATRVDLFGEPGVSHPTGVEFQGPFVWVSNAAGHTGSAAALDPNPGAAPNGPRGLAGEPVAGPTGTGVFGGDDLGFTVVRVVPADGAEGVGTRTAVYVEFSKPVDESSLTSGRVDLVVSSSRLSPDPEDPEFTLELRDGGRTLWFSHEELAPETVYQITVDSAVTDLDGNKLDGDKRFFGPDDFVSTFDTYRSNPDDPPWVVEVYPRDGETGVAADSRIWVRFSEPVTGVSGTTFYVLNEADGKKVDGEIVMVEDATRAILYPDPGELSADSCFTVHVTPGVEDEDDNPLDQIPGGDPDPFSSSFCTGAGASTFCVGSMEPVPGSSGQDVRAPIVLTFSTPYDLASVRSALSVSMEGGAEVAGEVTGLDDYRVEFVPSEDYGECARVVVRLSAGARSAEGEPLDGDCDGQAGDAFQGTFDTRCDNPYVVSASPACGEVGVSLDTAIAVCFSELMDHDSLRYAFSVVGNGQEIPGTLSFEDLSGSTCLTFTPSCADPPCLAPRTRYEVTVSTEARDRQGHHLDQDRNPANGATPFSCTFETGSGTSNETLCVESTSPVNGAEGVSPETAISVVFTLDLDPGTVNADTFQVSGPTGRIEGSYSVANRGAQFVPAERLLDGSLYMVVLGTGIRSLTGIPLDGDCDGFDGPAYSFSFRTGEGRLTINEVVTDPQQDWDDSGGGNGQPFDATPGVGNEDEITADDEWIEIYNGTGSPIDITGYRLVMTDSSTHTEVLGDHTGAVEVYSPGSSSGYFQPGGYLVVGNPADQMNNAVYVQLYDAEDRLIDAVEIGDDPAQDGDGDGAPDPGADGNASSVLDEAIARCPNGADTDDDPADFVKAAATIGSSNDTACGGMAALAGMSAPRVGLPSAQGLGGIVAAGTSPDEPGAFNQLLIAFQPEYELLYAIDFDDGVYPLEATIEAMTDLAFKPLGGTPGQGYLFIGTSHGTVIRTRLAPSGPVGQAGTTVAIDRTVEAPFIRLASPYVHDATSIAYSAALDRLFVADCASGNVVEMATDGETTTVYLTGLGPQTLSAIDVGDLGQGEEVVIATTGGGGMNEFSGPHGTLYRFLPVD
jgi:hypothetical protein